MNDAEAQSWAEKALSDTPCWLCFCAGIGICLFAIGLAVWGAT